MKILQNWSIIIIDKNIDYAINKFNIIPNETNLALSGGYSLNCPTNTHIVYKYGFKKQLMIPCVNDGGQSIDSGLIYFYKNILNLKFKFSSAYLGNKSQVIRNEFNNFVEDSCDNLEHFVEDIIENPIIWIDERSEIGPRALGHRSILGDPRVMETKTRLNLIKQREWWRPVAPIIFESACSQWFENSFESKYMLNNFTIQKDRKNLVPAILHLDNTCRVQTISDEKELLYKAIELFYKKTDIPLLCNTSLNDKGEPIIDTIDQAFNFALRKGIKVVYANGRRYLIKNFVKYEKNSPLKRNDNLFIKYRESTDLCEKMNPYNVSSEELFFTKIQISAINLILQTSKK